MKKLWIQKRCRPLCALLLMLGLLVSAGCSTNAPAPAQAPTKAPTQVPTESVAVPETTEPAQTDPEEQQQESTGAEVAAWIGNWERTHTEVEGDRQTTEAGLCNIAIAQLENGDLQIAYTDRDFPDNSYEDKALHIVPNEHGGYFDGSEWMAQVDHTGNFGMTYTLALLEDGSLLLRNYWLMEGAPMVSYEWFTRAS